MVKRTSRRAPGAAQFQAGRAACRDPWEVGLPQLEHPRCALGGCAPV